MFGGRSAWMCGALFLLVINFLAVCQELCKTAESSAASDAAGIVSRLNFKLRMTA